MIVMMIGAAVFRVIGAGPTKITDKRSANWPEQEVFGGEPFIQPTGLGARTLSLSIATRPHELGGLDAFALLKAYRDALEPQPVLRLTLGAGLAPGGDYLGLWAVTSFEHEESKIAPSGIGWRHEGTLELKALGELATGWGAA